MGAARVRANLSRMGGKRILAFPGFINYEWMSALGSETNREKSWFLARGSVPAPSISGMRFIASGRLNLLVGVLNCYVSLWILTKEPPFMEAMDF